MNPESLRSSRQVDVDQLTKDFTQWHAKHQDLVLQNSNLQLELNGLNSQHEQDKITEKSTEEELKKLREIIESLQDSLVKRCDMEDENKTLKDLVFTMEGKVQTAKEEGQAVLIEVETHLGLAHNEEKALREETHHQQIRQMEEQTRILETSLRDRSAKVKQLHQQLAEATKDRQTEIIKLRLEYDAKLLKLQSANTRSLQRSDKPSSASSLIFREKMLNAQAASEREVASLRQTVSELKRKLDGRQSSSSAKRKH